MLWIIKQVHQGIPFLYSISNFEIFCLTGLGEVGCGYLMQEQPTLEMTSAGSDTQETSSLNRSFNIRFIRDS